MTLRSTRRHRVYCVTVKLRFNVCVTPPPVAVTTTVEVLCIGAPPPQPASVVPVASAAPTINRLSQRRRLRAGHTRRASATAPPVSGQSVPPLCRGLAEAEDDVVAIVKVVCAGEVPGVTLAGAKLQDAPAGKPEQANVTACIKPSSLAREMMKPAGCPATTPALPGEAAKVKFGAGTMVRVTGLAVDPR